MATKVLASSGKDLAHSNFLQALAEREEANRNGKLTVFFVMINCAVDHLYPDEKRKGSGNIRIHRLCPSIKNREFRACLFQCPLTPSTLAD
jgi:hypothetical protein